MSDIDYELFGIAVTYFITCASAGDRKVQMGNVVARHKREAVTFAADNYRKVFNLKTNVHVDVRVLYESSDPQRASEFYDLLMEKIAEEKNASI